MTSDCSETSNNYFSRKILELKIRQNLSDISKKGSGCMLVYGEGGIGKTTIVAKVYSDNTLKETCGFEVKMWLNSTSIVGTEGRVNKEQLWQEVDNEIKAQQPDRSSLHLGNCNHGILLVIDDVRDERLPGEVCACLAKLGMRCVIIFISRTRHPSMLEWVNHVERISPWTRDEICDLFKMHNIDTLLLQEDKMNLFLAISNGLPLVAQILISSLANLTQNEAIIRIRELAAKGTELVNALDPVNNANTISRVLQITFNYIGVELLNCLYAVLLFEEGEGFAATDLMIIWGLTGRQEISDSFIIELYDRSILRPASTKENVDERYFTVHALLRQAILDHLANAFVSEERRNVTKNMYLGCRDYDFIEKTRNYLANEQTKQARRLLLTEFRQALCNGRFLTPESRCKNILTQCVALRRWRLIQLLLRHLSNESIAEFVTDPVPFLKRLFKLICYDSNSTVCQIFCKIIEAILSSTKINRNEIDFEQIGDVNSVFGKKKETLLMIAAENKCPAFFRYLMAIAKPGLLEMTDSSGNTALHNAITAGDLVTASMLLDSQIGGELLTIRNAKGLSPLAQALIRNDAAIIDLLLEHGSNPNELFDDGEESLLYFAAGDCCDEIVKRLLTKGAYFQHVDGAGWAPIHNAALRGRTRNLSAILKHAESRGVQQIELKARNGDTPLIIAASHGKIEAAELLLNIGADLEATNNDGDTALVCSAYLKVGHIVGRFLIKRGANMDLLRQKYESEIKKYPNLYDYPNQIKNMETFLKNDNKPVDDQKKSNAEQMALREEQIWQAVITGDIELFMQLANSLSSNALLNTCNYLGRTLLHEASARGYIDIVYSLLECGADLNAKSNSEDFYSKPIHLSALHDRYDITKLFISKDIDLIKAEDQNFNYPLHVAAKRGNDSVVVLLLDSGADIEAEGSYKRTPLLLAASNGQNSTVELLLRRGANWKKLDYNNSGAIHLAVYFGHLEVVRTLIRRKPELLEMPNGRDQTPLYRAAYRGRKEVANFLLEENAVITKETFFVAVENNRCEIVQLLLDRNADLLESLDDNANTALLLAAQYGHVELAKTLLSRGANVTWRNRQGKDAIDLAKSAEVKALFSY